MPVCSFCKQSYEFPRGTTVVQKDGNIRFYCTSKCRKNSEMGRDNKKVNWVRKSDIAKEEKAKKDATREQLLLERKTEQEAKQAKEAAKRAAKKEKKSLKTTKK